MGGRPENQLEKLMDDPLELLRLGQTIRQPGPEPVAPDEEMVVEVEADRPDVVTIDPATGAMTIEHGDGSITIDASPEADEDEDTDHFANLAEKMDGGALSSVADELLQGIEQDDQGRQEWLDTRVKGISLLDLTLRTPSDTAATGQLAGTSKVNHPMLKEAVLRFQANARSELLPTDGPVKVKNYGEESKVTAELASALEDDFNFYLTTTASEYYPDTDRMLLWVGFGGCAFKKVYSCPLRRRPVSESVDAKDLIVSNAATDLKSCGRVTHRVMMRPSTVKRMQLVGAYRDVELSTAVPRTPNVVDAKIAETQGIVPQSGMAGILDRDREREILECYCELDIPGYEHKEGGEVTGLPLPYKVTIDRDSRQVLEIRRNWEEDDDDCEARTVFVKYPFVPGFGFYDLGLLQILGSMTEAASAGWREMLDAGMFASFPGFLYLKSLARQLTNEFRVAPGSGVPIDAPTDDIRNAIMPLPYKEPGQATMALIQNIVETGMRVGGAPEIAVGEGKQDAPVGTTLALIEQATKVIDAVHKRLHQAQAQEFGLLKKLFIEDPSPLWRSNRRCKTAKLLGLVDAGLSEENAKADAERKKKVIAALADCDLVPQADPNTASQMARIMKAVAVKQLQMANPELYDAKEVDTRILRVIGWDDVDSLFAAPKPPSEAPDAMALMAMAKVGEANARNRKIDADAAIARDKIAAGDRQVQSKEKLAALGLQRDMLIHRDEMTAEERKRMDELAERTAQHQHKQVDRSVEDRHRNLDRLADHLNRKPPAPNRVI